MKLASNVLTIALALTLASCGGGGAPAPITPPIVVTNSAPVANAGVDQTGTAGQTITLSGAGSTDADKDALTYQWVLKSKPSGSAAALSQSGTVSPTFVADVAGTYVVTLVVNDGKVSSAVDEVSVVVSPAPVTNSAPVANAGVDQTGTAGQTITLSGAGSTDADKDALTYQWVLKSKPSGSAAALSQSGTVSPTFVADVAGTYVVTLVVNDGKVSSAVDEVSVVVSPAPVTNSAPVANLSSGTTMGVGSTFILDGRGSYDPEGKALTYQWSISDGPSGHKAILKVDPSGQKAEFMADKTGEYRISLTVDDGIDKSNPVYSNITIVSYLSGTLSGNTVLKSDQSPYIITKPLSIPGGSSLTIEPGVKVVGGALPIFVEGTLEIAGAPGNMVKFEGINLYPVGKLSSPHKISISFANITNGNLYSLYGSSNGSLILEDSILKGISDTRLSSSSKVNVERNVFIDSGTIYVLNGGSYDPKEVRFKNNLFKNWKPGVVGGPALSGGVLPGGSPIEISGNSFVGVADSLAVALSDFEGASLDVRGNFWNTIEEKDIKGMILDREDSVIFSNYVQYSPFLAIPSPMTPQNKDY